MKPSTTVLLVNRNQRNLELLTESLEKDGYATIAVSSLEAFDQALVQENRIGAVLVDITGFSPDIWTRCEQLRRTKKPFLVVSPKQSAAIQQASLSYGAKGIMIKPLVIKELRGLIQSMLEEQG